MIAAQIVLKALNQVLRANPRVLSQLCQLAGRTILIQAGGLSLNFEISPAGSLISTEHRAECQIHIPLMASQHLLHGQELLTFKTLNIQGDNALAHRILNALAACDISKVLYQTQIPLLGIVAVKIEALIHRMLAYIRLILTNGALSLNQYLQYESDWLSDKFQLEDFYHQVDELSARTALLSKRLERLTRS